MTQHPRRLLWDGCLNVRDLGGYIAADGRITRASSLIRSDNLARLTAAGQQIVRETGVSTIIDVRSHYELNLESNPFAQMSVPDLLYLNLPLLDETDTKGVALISAAPMTEMYRIMLERFQSNIGKIMTAIADAPLGAVVFHCHSGKDRTGLVAALALKSVGVLDADIAADYALSDSYLGALYSEMLAKKVDPEARARLAEQLTSKPEAILGALLHLEERYGGIEPYLKACGLNLETQRKLRERLLEPMP